MAESSQKAKGKRQNRRPEQKSDDGGRKSERRRSQVEGQGSKGKAQSGKRRGSRENLKEREGRDNAEVRMQIPEVRTPVTAWENERRE